MASQQISEARREPAPRRTQSERRRSSELGLLAAAVDVIAERGVSAVTFDAVGSVSGLSRGLATQRFGSKARMIEALIAHLHDRQAAIIERCDDPSLSGFAAVRTYIDHALSDYGLTPQGRAYFMLLSSAVGDASDLRQAFRDMHRSVEGRLVTWIGRGQVDGTIRVTVDSPAAALMIGCLILGVSMQLLVDPEMAIEPVKAASIATIGSALAA